MSDSLDLDELLADSLLAKKMKSASHPKERKQKAMSSSNAHWLNEKEKSEFERQIANSEARMLWRPEAAVAMFAVQICLKCGSRHTHFEGFFQQQRHASYRETERWVPATDSTMLADLPRHRKITLHESDACVSCIDSLGYIQPSPTSTEPAHATWSPTQNHQKHSSQLDYSRGFIRED